MEATEAASDASVPHEGNGCDESGVERVEILSPSIGEPPDSTFSTNVSIDETSIFEIEQTDSHRIPLNWRVIRNIACHKGWKVRSIQNFEYRSIVDIGTASSVPHFTNLFWHSTVSYMIIIEDIHDNQYQRIIRYILILELINHSRTSEAGKPDPRAWVVATATMSREQTRTYKTTASSDRLPEELLEQADELLELAAENLDEIHGTYINERLRRRIDRLRERVEGARMLGIDVNGDDPVEQRCGIEIGRIEQ